MYTLYCTSQLQAMETLESLMQQNKLFESFVYVRVDSELYFIY
mgnify:CR=1 FL=1